MLSQENSEHLVRGIAQILFAMLFDFTAVSQYSVYHYFMGQQSIVLQSVLCVLNTAGLRYHHNSFKNRTLFSSTCKIEQRHHGFTKACTPRKNVIVNRR